MMYKQLEESNMYVPSVVLFNNSEYIESHDIPPTRSWILPSVILNKTYGSAIVTDDTAELSEADVDSDIGVPKVKS